MARGLNHVYLFGALARDPELRYTPNGTAVLDVTVAGEDNVLGNDGKPRVLPWYHRCSLLGKQAEQISDQYKAGDPVMIEGALEFRSWETPEGQKRSQVSVKALRVEGGMPGGRSEVTVRDSQGGHRLTNAFNEVVLIGNLTKDVELRLSEGGIRRWREDVRLYEEAEMRSLLSGRGLAIETVHGDFDGQPFGPESRRMLITARR